MSAHVCEMFQSLYAQIPDEDGDINQRDNKNLLYLSYCPQNGDEHQKCNTDLDRISAGFGYLVPQLYNNVESEEDHGDQKGNYIYYGMMWICYKLQQINEKDGSSINLKEFFNNYVVNGEWYGEIKEYVEPHMSLLNNDNIIEHMSNIYQIFKQMCKIFSNNDEQIDNINFMSYYESVKSCGENILKKNSNDANRDISDSCPALYDVLNHIYNDFKNDCIAIMNSPINALPDIPNIEEIKKTLESNSENLDSQDSTDRNHESQDWGSENCERTIPENELEPPQNNNTIEEIFKPDLSTFEIKLANFETELPHFEIELAKFEPELPNVLDGIEVPDIEIGHQIFLDGVEVPDIESEFPHLEIEYPDVQEELFYIDTEFSKLEDDLPFFEVKYLDLENDSPNIVDELYVPEAELSNSAMIPQIIDFNFPDLNNEQTDFDNEQADSDNQSQPHQINTLIFDNPFENPENFSDNIMCKLHGPKSVYCNRIICNRIKIGVIALSIPIVLVFIYKYFPWKRTKKPKKTKKMKRVVNLLDRKKTKKIDINSIDDKKTIQTIINSNDKKKTPKRIINSNDKEKTRKRIINSNDKEKTRKRIINSNDKEKTTLLFNIYKQMQLSPMPFIHLFMLLIFFIFKRKKNSIE
ncbi:CIR protein [Plasmodium chabaudi chabaudi]|uniref:CIR protein n=1 Tax=Plasmodium chabaudi chabaudi TaxID=31271 RepID=A0A1D3L9Y0_PLACU|nr:CIR protein [Plasmodium chabaudi chabaudi]